jgi:hypothetical protein
MLTEARCLTPGQLLRVADTLVVCEMLRSKLSRNIHASLGHVRYVENSPENRERIEAVIRDTLGGMVIVPDDFEVEFIV